VIVTLELIVLALATAVRPTSLAAIYALLSSSAPRRLMTLYVIAGTAFTLVVGLLVLSRSLVIGGLLILVVALVFFAQSLRVARVSWNSVERKSDFLGYPIFVVTRNFSMAIGYTVALAAILVRKVDGKPIAWDNI